MTPRTSMRLLIVILICGALSACGQPSNVPQRSAPSEATPEKPDTHMEEADTVEVDEGMLRDLRITTRAVESRPGGEQIVVDGAFLLKAQAEKWEGDEHAH